MINEEQGQTDREVFINVTPPLIWVIASRNAASPLALNTRPAFTPARAGIV
jgi:hypothetical protein